MSPKNLKLWGIAAGVVMIGIVVAVMVVIGSGARTHTVDKSELARVQVRSFPAKRPVLYDGREQGDTPKMILVPMSDTPVEVTVIFAGGHRETKTIQPNVDHQLVDFKYP